MTHQYAAILNGILEGKTIQWLLPSEKKFVDISEPEAFRRMVYTGAILRVKPDTLNIAGIGVVKPMADKPRINQMFYYLDAYSYDGVGDDYWSDSKEDNQKLHNGMCWLTREHAVNAADAIKKLLMGE